MSEEQQPATRIVVRPTLGPYRVEGEIHLVDPEGNTLPLPERKDPRRLSLCGCGHSKKWPICDGTHKTLAAHDGPVVETPPA